MQIFNNDFEVRDDGTVILPAGLLEDFGLKVGDTVRAIQTEKGILIAPRKLLITMLLDEIGDDLKAKEFTFEQILADSETIRQAIYDEKYAPHRD